MAWYALRTVVVARKAHLQNSLVAPLQTIRRVYGGEAGLSDVTVASWMNHYIGGAVIPG